MHSQFFDIGGGCEDITEARDSKWRKSYQYEGKKEIQPLCVCVCVCVCVERKQQPENGTKIFEAPLPINE